MASPRAVQAPAPQLDARRADRPFVRWLLPVALFALAFAPFWPALGQGFAALDDDINFERNPYWRGFSEQNVEWMWRTNLLGHRQPLSWLSLALDWELSGGEDVAQQIHRTNLLLHAGGALVLYFVLQRLLLAAFAQRPIGRDWIRLAAFGGAALHAMHPLRVESVVWATERRDVLSGLFLFAVVLFYLRRHQGGTALATLAALAFYVLSLMSKAWGMTLPAVLLALDVFPLRRNQGEQRRTLVQLAFEKWPYLLLAAFAAWKAAQAQGETMATESLERHGVVQRFAQACYGLCFYVWKTIVPTDLSPLYVLERNLDPMRPVYLASIAAVALSTFAAIRWRRRFPGVVVALVCYAIVVGPVLGVLQSGAQKVADRYSYLACVPFAALWAAAIWRLAARPLAPAALALALAPLPVLGALTWRQALLWESGESLWRRAVAVEPDNYFAQHNLAAQINLRARATSDSAERRRLFEQAIEHELLSIQSHPARGNEGARQDLGALYQTIGEQDKAVATWTECLEVTPEWLPCLMMLRDHHLRRGDPQAARELIERSIARAPGAMPVRDLLAEFHLQRNEKEKAAEVWEQALRVHGGWVPGLIGLARLRLGAQRPADAEKLLRVALAQNEADAELDALARLGRAIDILNDLGFALRRQGRVDEAELCWMQALSIDPNNATARQMLEQSRSDARRAQ